MKAKSSTTTTTPAAIADPPAPPQTQLTVVPEYSTTAAALAELGDKYGKAVFDVTTTKGMTAAREARAEIKAYRVNLEKMRVEIKAPALERCRLIDAEAKRIAGELLALETPIDETIKAQEAIKDAERAAKVEAERERLAQIERERLAAEQAEREAAINAEREKLAAERAQFERERAEAAAAEEQRRKDADLALAAQRAAEAERVAAERKAYDEQVAAERKAEAEARAERDRQAQVERDRLAEERRQLEEQRAEDARRKHANMLIDLKANSTDLAAAAIEAHEFLCANGYADHHITLALGFAIEHNAAQQQLPLETQPASSLGKKAAAKKPTPKKGAKA